MAVLADELLEREDELARLEALLEQAGSGAGRLLVIEGPPGIGKTRLLKEARERAAGRGMEPLRARGGELEREFAFGLVHQLFTPLATAEGDGHERLFSGAAALARPLLVDAEAAGPTAPADPYSLFHGLYWLTSNAAEQRPLLLAVDDAHWGDPPSLRFLSFLARRLEDLPVLLAIATRPGETGAARDLLAEIAVDPLAETLVLGPLSVAAVARLVRSTLSADAADEFCMACHRASGGNPFVLRELLTEVRTESLAPTAEAARTLEELTPKTVSRAVLLRLSRLGDPASALARAVAVLGDGAELRLAAALAGLDRHAGVQAAAALAAADILSPGRPLFFVHPLARAAVYGDLAHGDRARMHELAAQLFADEPARDDELAIHLLATDAAGDQRVVTRLRDAARRALARGAPDVAIRYLRRALAEPPPPEERAPLLLELGHTGLRAGDTSTLEAFEQGFALSADPRERAERAPDLATMLRVAGREQEALALLERAAAEVAEVDSELALRTEAELLAIAGLNPSLTEAMLERFEGRIQGKTAAERRLLAPLSLLVALRRVSAAEAGEMAERALSGEWAPGQPITLAAPLHQAIHVLIMADRLQRADRVLDQTLAEARRRGSAVDFVVAATARSHLAYRRGALEWAEGEARHALDAARPLGILPFYPLVLAYLIEILVERDEPEAAQEALLESGIGEQVPAENVLYMRFLFSRGRLRIARGEMQAGLRDLLEVARLEREWELCDPPGTPAAGTAAPVLVALGETEQARDLAERALELGRRWGTPRSIGMALCSAGLVAGGDEGLGLLSEAVAVLRRSADRLEYARALGELGAALRRAGKRSEARTPLREALELARRCHAVAIAKRAHAELEATGERIGRLTLVGPGSLTPSERRIAEMAAEGRTNREIAQDLFLSVKTVEMHLSHAYRKLDIGSRAELPKALSAQPA